MKNSSLIIAAAFLAAASIAPAKADSEPPAITVTGEANISAAPDEASISAGVTNEAKTARAAAEANNVAMGKVLLELKSAGINEKDVRTSRVSLYPQYTSPKNGPTTISGYRASNDVEVRIRDVKAIGDVIDKLVAAGANDIGSVQFTVKDSSKLLDEAREKALQDAKRKAEIYAKAAGVTLGAPLQINEGGPQRPVMLRRMASDGAPMAASAPIAPGESTLSVSVSVSWGIKTP